jgi:hypothetical protein
MLFSRSFAIFEKEKEIENFRYFNSDKFEVLFSVEGGKENVSIKFRIPSLSKVELKLDSNQVDFNASFLYYVDSNSDDVFLALRFYQPPKIFF